MDKNEIISALTKKGSIKINGLTIKNVTITELDNYTRVALTIDKPVKAYIQDKETGEYIEGTSNVIFTSLYAIVANMRESDKLAFISNHVLEHPNALELILSRAKIDVLQEPVVSGEIYKNPWSTDATEVAFDHNTYINHVINIIDGPFTDVAVSKIADSLLGI